MPPRAIALLMNSIKWIASGFGISGESEQNDRLRVSTTDYLEVEDRFMAVMHLFKRNTVRFVK
jgi:hypothetical protein